MKLCGFDVGLDRPFFLIAGPCVVESRAAADRRRRAAEGDHCARSACRSSSSRPTTRPTAARAQVVPRARHGGGPRILAEVQAADRRAGADRRARRGRRSTTVAAVVDVLQTPAFLCRQTDFIHARRARRQAGQHQEGPVPVALGNEATSSTRRARRAATTTSWCASAASRFGYNNLVSDMRSLAIMRETGCPVVFDATHSVQLPGGQGTASRRPARVRAGAGARRGGGRRRRRLHGNASRPGEGALRRAERVAAAT